MKTASNHNGQPPTMHDRIAKILSDFILRFQVKLAAGLSKRFNAYSVRRQKLLFVSIGLLTIAILISGLFVNLNTIPAIHQSYKPATHIGMASDVARPNQAHIQLTDSLIKNY